jgi:NAD(P)-dependent dehydrogenase (short-subunit alcohol dehydrogenase family)
VTRVNQTGYFLGAQAAVQQFLRQQPRAPTGLRGKVINISSRALLRQRTTTPICASSHCRTHASPRLLGTLLRWVLVPQAHAQALALGPA